MEVNKYRKKPVVVEAVLYTGYNSIEVAEFVANDTILLPRTGDSLPIKTLEGVMMASIGDYIIKGIKGEFYPCKPDIFEATYEPVHLHRVIKDEPGIHMEEDDFYGKGVRGRLIDLLHELRYENHADAVSDKVLIDMADEIIQRASKSNA